jgi:hypothetical protein
VAPRVPLLAEKAARVPGLGRPTGGEVGYAMLHVFMRCRQTSVEPSVE